MGAHYILFVVCLEISIIKKSLKKKVPTVQEMAVGSLASLSGIVNSGSLASPCGIVNPCRMLLSVPPCLWVLPVRVGWGGVDGAAPPALVGRKNEKLCFV